MKGNMNLEGQERGNMKGSCGNNLKGKGWVSWKQDSKERGMWLLVVLATLLSKDLGVPKCLGFLGLRIGKHGKGNCCTKGDKEGTQRGQNATFVGDADFVSFMLPN